MKRLFLSVAIVILSFELFAIVLKSDKNSIELSDSNGALLNVLKDGTSVAVASETSFVLRFIDKQGNYVVLDNTNFKTFKFENSTAYWSGCDKFPQMKVSLKVSASNGEFRFRPKVDGIPENLILEYIEAPRVNVPIKNTLLYPWAEGLLVGDNQKNQRKQYHFGFPDGSEGYYPGCLQMQFMASYSKNGGLLFLADDPFHSTKMIEFSKEKNGNLGLRIESACGRSIQSSSYEQPFDVVIKLFDGDWRDACTIYREHIKPSMKSRTPVKPKWMKDSPVVITYCVRGAGKLTHDTNKLIPYENAYPYLDKLAKGFDSKIMALIMRWDHGGPWMPPYYWPPVGGADSFRNLRDMLHKDGHLIGLYGSGTAYTIKSKLGEFSQKERYERENISAITTRGRKGESRSPSQNLIRDDEGLCISQKQTCDIVLNEILLWAKEGVDFAQYFDQNLGCASFVCYSREHGHPPVPGQWQTDAMLSLQKQINAKLKEMGSEMVLGTEAAVAEPYIGELAFNDLRDCFAMLQGRAVPAYQWVYHAYANNFYGNQCMVARYIDHKKAPDNLQFRLAQAFCAGEMLTVYMLDNGTIYWCAMTDWTLTPPNQETIITLIKNLNSARKAYPQYLMDGEMVKPSYDITTGKYIFKRTYKDMEYPEVLSAAFRDSKGNVGNFFVNFHTQPKKIKITRDSKTEEIEIAPLSVVFREVLKK